MKYLLFVLLVLNMQVCVGESITDEKIFHKRVDEVDNLLREAGEKGDYHAHIESLETFIKEWPQYSEEIREENQPLLSFYTYDLACYLSLSGQEKKAINAFEESIKNGWIDYRHALSDPDLDNLRDNPKFNELIEEIREYDFLVLLQKSGNYSTEYPKGFYPFQYQGADHPDLIRVRKHFNLDSIAGTGDEISQIKNLLLWVHNVVRHDGNSYNPESRNAIDIIEICKRENRGVNCRMMALVLNECFLAMGFPSRFVTCMPQVMVSDCHVINSVYSRTLDKWIWVDPTFNAYVTDENGNLLSIAEVRQRLKNDFPLVLNEEANWNNQNKQTKEHYLDYYMAKNLYYVFCPLRSEFNIETWYEDKEPVEYIALCPQGFIPDDVDYIKYYTDNEKAFWQSPL